jgi:membrane-bound lytic murein transglycosylase MltF
MLVLVLITTAATSYTPTRDLIIYSEVTRLNGTPNEQRLLAETIITECIEADIDPLLMLAIIHVESNFHRYATSPVGAQGLMQLMPATARLITEQTGLVPNSAHHSYNIEDNVRQGIRYYKEMLIAYRGVHAHALTAYNRGPTNTDYILRVNEEKLPEHVRNYYATKVLVQWCKLKAKVGNLLSCKL